MKKIILLLTVSFLPILAMGALSEFMPQEKIKASKINSNFSYIQELFQSKNIPMTFNSFQSGDIIEASAFEAEFDKVRTLNVEVSPLLSEQIKSSELNNAFSQMASGVVALNDVPVSSNFAFNVNEDSTYNGSAIFVNNNGPSNLQIIAPPQHGNLVNLGNGNFSYSPGLNYNGSDSFSYKIVDDLTESNLSVANITVNAVNDNPVASAQTKVLDEDVAVNITLVASDVDSSDTLDYTIVSPPTKGSISGTLPNITYTPNLNLNGVDSFSFRVNDGTVFSNTAVVSLTINPIADAPVITPVATINVTNGSSATGSFVATDSDSSAFSSWTKTIDPTKGALTLDSATGAYSYTSASNSFGADSFKIKVSDGENFSPELLVNVNISCAASFHEESSQCLVNTRSCNIDNGTGTQSWVSGTSYTTCSVVSCNTGFQASANNYACDAVWPLGTDGDLTLASGSYRLDRSGSTLQVVDTTTSNVVKSNFGSYSTSGDTAGSCKVDFNSLTLNTGATLNVDDECKWLLMGVKNNATINGQINANSLSAGQVITTRAPDNAGNLTGAVISYDVVQRSGASGLSGSASSRDNTPGSGGAQACGFGGGGGAGSGIDGINKYSFAYTGGNQSFVVPAGVTSMNFKIWGAGGAGDAHNGYTNSYGGAGDSNIGYMTVTPGETLNIIVGQGGTTQTTAAVFGGGGIGALASSGHRSNGGGLSGIFKGSGAYSQATAIAIAGGGGAGGPRDGYNGGGARYNAAGYNNGYAGTTSAGGCNPGVTGSIGARGGCGSALQGGNGNSSSDNAGGGGGGGYFGGGAGNSAGGAYGGGGGGGASYNNPTYATGSFSNSGSNTTYTGDWQYPGSSIGTGGHLSYQANGFNGYVILSLRGSQGGNGAVSDCSSPAAGGTSSLNGGGAGGAGGNRGLHGQGVYIKTWGNILGNGKINVAGSNGTNGVAGATGGTNSGQTFGNGGSGGGGAGGSGGKIIINRKGSISPSLIFDLAGGTAGSGGSGSQNGLIGIKEDLTL